MQLLKIPTLFLYALLLQIPLFSYAGGEPRPPQKTLPARMLNDREIKIKSTNGLSAKRAELIKFVWGAAGMPLNKQPSSIEYGAVRPDNLKNLERVDTLHISMDAGVRGIAHHFIPKNKKKNRLVILHLGHTDNCTLNDNVPGEPDIGMRRTINALLSRGYSVLGLYMPQVTPEDCRWGHDQMFSLKTVGNPLKFFLEPTLVSLNYIQKKYPQYSDYVMVGLSGGGWTTTLYAALDPRVKTSIPIAGSLPLYLCYEGYGHDTEQRLDSFYRLAGYPDLYVLGSYGAGRKQVQVLNRRDDCCFGERQHIQALVGMSYDAAVREYEGRVSMTLKQLGAGSFRVFIDEKASGHLISDHAIRSVILPELK